MTPAEIKAMDELVREIGVAHDLRELVGRIRTQPNDAERVAAATGEYSASLARLHGLLRTLAAPRN